MFRGWIVALLLFSPAWALEIYVNNKPYQGPTSGSAKSIQLEAGKLFALLDGDFQVKNGRILFGGESLTLYTSQGHQMVSARELVDKIGGRYAYSADLDVLDIYAFDPAEAARKSLERVMALRTIENETDLAVLSRLTRQTLESKLGLDLQDRVNSIHLATADGIRQAGGPANAACYLNPQAQIGGGGSYNILVLKGMAPDDTIRALSWAWGVGWARGHGDDHDDDLLRGFGEWTAYRVLRELTKVRSPETVFRRYERADPRAIAAARRLVEVESLDGVDGVLEYMDSHGH
ncbi:MAG: hypothetical protein KC910_12985 [Candidatus Eremiobacteraeota bacterium]|nr:hypothetical protein [Candidatus Eremiobacteraeota bacterium]